VFYLLLRSPMYHLVLTKNEWAIAHSRWGIARMGWGNSIDLETVVP
jgi:hypothetical protein